MRVDEAEFRGAFWIETDGAKYPGVLTIAKGGEVSLSLRNVPSNHERLSNTKSPVPQIIGVTEDDHFVRLFDCRISSWPGALVLGGQCMLDATVGIIGEIRRRDIDELTLNNSSFTRFNFRVDCLQTWHGISGFSSKFDSKSNYIGFDYHRPAAQLLWRDDSAELWLMFSYSIKPVGPDGESPQINQTSFLQFRTVSPKDSQYFIRRVNSLLDFFVIATGEPVCLFDVEASNEDHAVVQAEEKRFRFLRVLYRSFGYQERRPSLESFNVLIGYRYIASKSQEVFDKWFQIHDNALPAFSLYSTILRGGFGFLDSKFLSITQALEAYHRGKHVNVGKTFFRARLLSMFSPLKELFEPNSSIEELATVATSNRNYFTHWARDLKSKASHGHDLYRIFLRLDALFRLTVCLEIGISIEEIKEMSKECNVLLRQLNY